MPTGFPAERTGDETDSHRWCWGSGGAQVNTISISRRQAGQSPSQIPPAPLTASANASRVQMRLPGPDCAAAGRARAPAGSTRSPASPASWARPARGGRHAGAEDQRCADLHEEESVAEGLDGGAGRRPGVGHGERQRRQPAVRQGCEVGRRESVQRGRGQHCEPQALRAGTSWGSEGMPLRRVDARTLRPFEPGGCSAAISPCTDGCPLYGSSNSPATTSMGRPLASSK